LAILFSTSIYLNASSQRLRDSSHRSDPSDSIVENKRWVAGRRLFDEAHQRGEDLPLIWSHFAELTFWAIAADITVHESTTEYRFRNLTPIRGYRRRDLIVESTGAALPNEFIRSYALVRTPGFLTSDTERGLHSSKRRTRK
jgi:hypothetical protein